MPYRDPEQKVNYHRRKAREWAAKERARRMAAGTCIVCRTPVTQYRKCFECRWALRRRYLTVERPRLKARALACQDCQRRCVRPGARRCGKCTAIRANAIRWERHRQKGQAA